MVIVVRGRERAARPRPASIQAATNPIRIPAATAAHNDALTNRSRGRAGCGTSRSIEEVEAPDDAGRRGTRSLHVAEVEAADGVLARGVLEDRAGQGARPRACRGTERVPPPEATTNLRTPLSYVTCWSGVRTAMAPVLVAREPTSRPPSTWNCTSMLRSASVSAIVPSQRPATAVPAEAAARRSGSGAPSRARSSARRRRARTPSPRAPRRMRPGAGPPRRGPRAPCPAA